VKGPPISQPEDFLLGNQIPHRLLEEDYPTERIPPNNFFFTRAFDAAGNIAVSISSTIAAIK
jgi:hypothetical protein